jgi:HEAT repeat protein
MLSLSAVRAADNESEAADLKTLKEAGLDGEDGAGLLNFFRSRTLADEDRDKIQALIRQLGDDDYSVRDRASRELEKIGAPAVSLLRQARRLDDVEVVCRAEKCLERIDKVSGPAVASAAARRLARLKPTGAAETLLAYLPFVEEDSVAEEVESALAAVALVNGQPDQALTQALRDDALPSKKAAAAVALIRSGSEEQRRAMHRLLEDRSPQVRWRVASALLAIKDVDSVPVLIELLAVLPLSEGRQVETLLNDLGGDLAPKEFLQEDEASRKVCRDAWVAWWKANDGPGLLEFFRKQTPTDVERDHIKDLIRQLNDDMFTVRADAEKQLAFYGPKALSLLRSALQGARPEAAPPGLGALRSIEKEAPRGSSLTDAARLLALRRPPGAVEVLLAYLPCAEDDNVVAEIWSALSALALRDGKLDTALVAALSDKNVARRAGAAVALCRGGTPEIQPDVRKLLKDEEPEVRLHVATAMVAEADKDAVPVLIDLLTQLPADQVWKAEGVLQRVALERAPNVTPGGDAAERKKCRDAWAEWWRQNSERIKLVRLDETRHLLGFTMVVLTSPRGVNNGQVMELGLDGKPRWVIEGLQSPIDAQVLGPNRVLVAEVNGQQVTERNFKGDILWRKQVSVPVNCQRLANGNTFIACRNQLMEVDKTGREIFNYPRPNGDILSAQKLPNGQIVFLAWTGMGMLIRLDATGKEVKSFPINFQPKFSAIEVLPTGGVLVPNPAENKVLEYDAEGKVVGEIPVLQPSSVSLLPNGHLLITGLRQIVQEVDMKGHEFWQSRVEGRVIRARRR